MKKHLIEAMRAKEAMLRRNNDFVTKMLGVRGVDATLLVMRLAEKAGVQVRHVKIVIVQTICKHCPDLAKGRSPSKVLSALARLSDEDKYFYGRLLSAGLLRDINESNMYFKIYDKGFRKSFVSDEGVQSYSHPRFLNCTLERAYEYINNHDGDKND